MDLLKGQPLECQNCKIDIMDGLSEFINEGEIICPHCGIKLVCSNSEEVQSEFDSLDDSINTLKKTINKLSKK